MSPQPETNRESAEVGYVGKYVNGQRIYELMEKRGYNKEQLARSTKLGRSTIDRAIDGTKQNPRISTLIAIAHVLRTTVDDITQPYTSR